MTHVVVETTIHLDPEEVYEFLLQFERYPAYSTYLESVRRLDDGGDDEGLDVGGGDDGADVGEDDDANDDDPGDVGPGARYALRFAWWKLGYTAHSEVVDVDPPYSIDWAVTKDVDAHGRWTVESVERPGETAEADRTRGSDPASRVTLEIRYDPGSVGHDVVDLPPLVSFSWLVERVQRLVLREGRHVVERIVADLEGEPRDVELRVTVDGEREL